MLSRNGGGGTVVRISVVGGGIGGQAAALFLARRGHAVTMFERDGRRPGGDLDADFFEWRRPRTPQAVQPHAFLAPVRNVLRAEAPDVYAAVRALGAAEWHEFDWFGEHPPARPGDEDLVTVRARRIVLETALGAAVAAEPGIEERLATPATGLVFDGDRVTGVRSAAGTVAADLVLDAGGRRSPVGDWLVEAGCRPPLVENHHIGIAYFSRWYRLRADGPANPGRVWDASIAPFAISLVFPSDNRVFAVALALPVADPTRGALRDPAVFDEVARMFPASAAWLALDPEGLGGVQVMAGLDNRWTSLVDEAGPVVTGLVGVGDSVTHTNPTLGQGASLALLAAQRVATTVDTAALDPEAFVAGYYDWATRTLKPWFDHQVRVDRGDEAFFTAAIEGTAPPPMDEATRAQLALTPCAMDDPVVMRARAQIRHLVLTPAQACGQDEIRTRIGRWLDAHPEFPATFTAGPTRTEWAQAITT